jgi:hypothetical protein
VTDSEVDPVPPRQRCRHCEDVIGVYEPMVLETPHGPRHTSLAAEPDLYGSADRSFHRACYLRAREHEL